MMKIYQSDKDLIMWKKSNMWWKLIRLMKLLQFSENLLLGLNFFFLMKCHQCNENSLKWWKVVNVDLMKVCNCDEISSLWWIKVIKFTTVRGTFFYSDWNFSPWWKLKTMMKICHYDEHWSFGQNS